MDIVDAQLHMGAGTIESTLQAMDAVGIQSVLIDEFWYWVRTTNPMHNHPGFEAPNGAWRSLYPTAQLASALHPGRFSYLVRIDRNDPQLESVMRVIASEPSARAFRFLATRNADETEAFINGDFDAAFHIAEDAGLPVCVFIPGHVEHLPRYLKKFPKLQFILDHWGLPMRGLPESDRGKKESADPLNEVLKLAEYPNVALKLSHAQMLLGDTQYPYEGIRPHLRRAIQAFGDDRLVWASDQTVTRPPISWSDLVHYLRDDKELSLDEKEKILGRNARRILKWTAAS